jgi:hypothetical protein
METPANVVVTKLDGAGPNGGTLMIIVDGSDKTVSLIEVRTDQVSDFRKLKVLDVQPYTTPGD